GCERWTAAAWAGSLAVFLKVYPVSLTLVLLLLFPRRLGWRWLGAMLGCAAAPFFLQEPGYVARQYGDWVNWGLNQRAGSTGDAGFQDLMLWWGRWLAPMSRETYVRWEIVGGGAVALVCWLSRHAPRVVLLRGALS